LGAPKSEAWKAAARAAWTPARREAAAKRMENNNRNPKGREPGFTHTNETRQKLSEARTGLIVRADGLSYRSPEARKQAKLKGIYNTTQAWYDAKFAEQGGHCALCPAVIYNKSSKYLGIDHDHACCTEPPYCGNCNRGLLCDRCNSLLERLEAVGVEWATNALTYLAQYKR
jgi:hypothetical protein